MYCGCTSPHAVESVPTFHCNPHRSVHFKLVCLHLPRHSLKVCTDECFVGTVHKMKSYWCLAGYRFGRGTQIVFSFETVAVLIQYLKVCSVTMIWGNLAVACQFGNNRNCLIFSSHCISVIGSTQVVMLVPRGALVTRQ